MILIYWIFGFSIAATVLGLASLLMAAITMDRTRQLSSMAAQQDVIETYLAQLVDEILGGFSVEPGIIQLNGNPIGDVDDLMMKMSEPTIDEPDTSEQDITNLKNFFKDATAKEKDAGWKDSADEDEDDDNDKPWLK